MNELIMANSKWEALYRKTTEDLKHADEMIRRLGNQLHEMREKQEKQPQCLRCIDKTDTHSNYKNTGRLTRSSCADTFKVRRELFPNTTDEGDDPMHLLPSDLFSTPLTTRVHNQQVHRQQTHGVSFGFGSGPLDPYLGRYDEAIELNDIDEAQDRYYADIATTTPPISAITTPPPLVRQTNRRTYQK